MSLFLFHNFKIVNIFTYLGTSINNKNNTEIKQRIIAASKCAYELNKYLRNHLFSKKTKIKIYRMLIKPVLMYTLVRHKQWVKGMKISYIIYPILF